LAISSPTDGDDLSTALGVLADSDASDVAFIAALQAMSLEVDDHPELIDTLLGYLVDAGNPTDWRLAVLNLLQESAFEWSGSRPNAPSTWRRSGRSSRTPTAFGEVLPQQPVGRSYVCQAAAGSVVDGWRIGFADTAGG
jgi:hypothetical protein